MVEKGYTERQLYEDFTYETLNRMGLLLDVMAEVRADHGKRAEMKMQAAAMVPGEGYPTLRAALRGQR